MNERPDFTQGGSALEAGLFIGTYLGNNQLMEPLVAIQGQHEARVIVAHAAVALEAGHVGCEVVVLFDPGAPSRSIVIGRVVPRLTSPADGFKISVNSEQLELSSERQIVLRCGKASLTLTPSGKIVLRGTYLLSRSSGPNKIKGASVEVN